MSHVTFSLIMKDPPETIQKDFEPLEKVSNTEDSFSSIIQAIQQFFNSIQNIFKS